jgi:hypothetical protein
VTNEPVTLTAVLASSSGLVPPAGQVTFFNGSSPLIGCVNEPVSTPDVTVTVTCQASFAASTSPEQLRAVFTPSSGSGMSGSIGGATLAVRRARSSIALLASNTTTKVGSNVTYTATPVSLAGSVLPSGVVEFLDRGKAVVPCASQALIGGRATCTLSYSTTGRHLITAVYKGDQNFRASKAPAESVRVIARGRITSFTYWTFAYRPTYTKILKLWIDAPPLDATVVLTCDGEGCPFAKRSTPVPLCTPTPAHKCNQPAVPTLALGANFRGRRLHPGTDVTVMITRPDWIGKYYRFTMRAGKAPKIQISCLAPGQIVPGRGCSAS